MNSTQLTLHSYTWSQWGFMNVPSFSGSNKAVFFCFCIQNHSQQAGGWPGRRQRAGWQILSPFLNICTYSKHISTAGRHMLLANMLITWATAAFSLSAQKHPRFTVRVDDALCTNQCSSLQVQKHFSVPVHKLGCAIVLHSVKLSQCTVIIIFFNWSSSTQKLW